MKESRIDQATKVRDGEDLDLDRLQKYLKQQLPQLKEPLSLQQFPGGYSNLTYLVTSGDLQFVLRRPPKGANIKSAHDMSREFKILTKLFPFYPKVPKPVSYTADESIIGAPFYLMERINGVILRHIKGREMLTREYMKQAAAALMETFVELHAVDLQKTGLDDFYRPGDYVKRQVEGWSKRYFKAKTDEQPQLEKVIHWLGENRPPVSETTFIHNDFKYDNLVFAENDWSKVIAVLDWEMATAGDPLMDLGTSLGYWINESDPAFFSQLFPSPTRIPGNPSRGELVEMYSAQSGRAVENIVFYYAYGLFKIATILQQIYYRFKKGFTQDQRFAQLGLAVSAFGKMALRAIEKQEIDDLF